MQDATALFETLSNRLSELLWQLDKTRVSLNSKAIPEGVFPGVGDKTPKACIQDINHDLQALRKESSEPGARFLAARIFKKIAILTTLCEIQSGKQTPVAASKRFNIKTLGTRQHWLKTVEDDIATLTAQQQALRAHLEHLKPQQADETSLTLQAELGEIERRLTLAREAFSKALADERSTYV